MRAPFVPYALLLVLLGTCLPFQAQAQYFGQNKTSYRALDFKTMKSSHFEMYYYTSDSTAQRFLNDAEKWYTLHQQTLQDTIAFKNPLIVYNHHADFQQTTIFNQTISVGTGGVTEGIKNRVVMPYTHANKETNHVLGHELVHAFQFNLIKTEDSLGLSNTQNIPLWIIEGMAEFLSIGREDPHTAMWIRDAVTEDFFPTVQDLGRNPRYFPYRYGHAFWAFVAGIWGEDMIKPLFVNIGKMGLDQAMLTTLGYSPQAFSKLWKENTERYYKPYLQQKEASKGEVLFDPTNSGRINISPSISPNGEHMVFLSEKDVISLDFYLADVANKKITKKIQSIKRASHIDFVSFVESAATWSPDSRQLALVVYAKGKNTLIIVDAQKGNIVSEHEFGDLYSFIHPSWSPDGTRIVVSGMRDGISDLYSLSLADGVVRTLTQDGFSDIHPSWSPDGRQVLFSSDRPQAGQTLKTGSFNLCVLDLPTLEVAVLPVFPGADNMNPHATVDNGILFLSDRDGFRNLYRHDRISQKTYRLTNYPTGISGYTKYSSALSYSASTSTVYYNLYTKGNYLIAKSELKDFQYLLVDNTEADRSAGFLPPKTPLEQERITPSVQSFSSLQGISPDSIQRVPYKSRFSLENIVGTGVGVAVNSTFGAGAAGGVFVSFSDVLKYHQLGLQLAVNGEIYDVGGGVSYLYRKNRIDWGIRVSHIPYLSAGRSVRFGLFPSGSERRDVRTDIIRAFEEHVGLLSYFPLSKIKRLEGQLGLTYYHYRVDRIIDTYARTGPNSYRFVRRDRDKLEGDDVPSSLLIYNVSAAYVGDNSTPGLVGPISGYRYRAGINQFFGELFYPEVVLDGRFYYFLKPFTAAIRGIHIGRYFAGGENERLYPLNAAFPNFVRGYNYFGIYRRTTITNAIESSSGRFLENDFVGSKILVANIELRVPFTGPKGLALIPSRVFFTQLALFADAGAAFASQKYKQQLFNLSEEDLQALEDAGSPIESNSFDPIFSAGISFRINLFGVYVIEPFYAIPFQRDDLERDRTGVFGINFFPAW